MSDDISLTFIPLSEQSYQLITTTGVAPCCSSKGLKLNTWYLSFISASLISQKSSSCSPPCPEWSWWYQLIPASPRTPGMTEIEQATTPVSVPLLPLLLPQFPKVPAGSLCTITTTTATTISTSSATTTTTTHTSVPLPVWPKKPVAWHSSMKM